MDRPFFVIDCEQRSPEWYSARAGILTGTGAADMLAKIKSGEAAARRDLRTRLVVERLTGQPQEDGFPTADMRRGTELEPEAFAAYEAASGELVQRVGFIRHNTLPIGCSPDGIVGDFDGGLELKVPRSATHLRYLRSGGAIPAEHRAQVRHFLFVTGCPWIDFVSYDPRFPEPLQLYVVRLRREDAQLETYETELTTFLAEVEAEYAEVAAMAQKVAA